MSIQNNISEKKTTITGIAVIFMGISYFVIPYFGENLWQPSKLNTGLMLLCGFLLILAPDSILSIAIGWMKKKTE